MDAKSVSNANGVKAAHGFGLRTAPPVPSAAAREGNYNNGGSSSDMDITSDSDEDTYGKHHSPQPSPQDYRTHVRFPHVSAQNGGHGRNGAKAFGFGGDELSDSATSNQVSYVRTFLFTPSRF